MALRLLASENFPLSGGSRDPRPLQRVRRELAPITEVGAARCRATDPTGGQRGGPETRRTGWIRPRVVSLAMASLLLLSAAVALGKPAPGPPTPRVGYHPQAVRDRLAVVDSADVSRACGNLSAPWAYRGPAGRHVSLRSYGRRHAGRDWAWEFSSRLTEQATLDTVRELRTTRVACDASDGAPVYLVRLYSGPGSTLALFNFQEGVVLLFDAEEPLGSIRLDDHRADTLWAMLAARLDDDPLLRAPRPRSTESALLSRTARDSGYVSVEELPEAIERVPPHYPESARLAGISGTVWVQALIGKDGRVRDAIVADGPDQLRDAALEAVWQWTFKPAFSNKEPVAVWVSIPVKFSLR